MPEGQSIGDRIRDIRRWRGLTLREAAELAGHTAGWLSKIELGQLRLHDRGKIESLAAVLRVHPQEFRPDPWVWNATDPTDSEAHAGVIAVEEALDVCDLGDDPGEPIRPWPEVAADLDRLAVHVQAADYQAQAGMVPALLMELHGLYVRRPEHRADVLVGLIRCYSSAMWICKRLGGRGLAMLAAKTARRCAEDLESPAWIGYTTWLLGDATGSLSRPRQYARAVRVADELSAGVDDPDVAQAYGMLQLSASLAAAVSGDRDAATTHLATARDMAGRLSERHGLLVGRFGSMWFGIPNVSIWDATITQELGDGASLVDRIDPRVQAIPSTSRRAEYRAELGRALISDRTTRGRGLALLLDAERMAPQRLHADLLVRSSIAEQLRAQWPVSAGRELRGLAYRMGLGVPTIG